MVPPAGESESDAPRLNFDRRLKLGDAQELMNRGASAAKCSGFPVVCGECIVTG